jgi:hypothetical protein
VLRLQDAPVLELNRARDGDAVLGQQAVGTGKRAAGDGDDRPSGESRGIRWPGLDTDSLGSGHLRQAGLVEPDSYLVRQLPQVRGARTRIDKRLGLRIGGGDVVHIFSYSCSVISIVVDVSIIINMSVPRQVRRHE